MTIQNQHLLNISLWRKAKDNPPAKLAEAVSQFFEKQVAPRQKKYGSLPQVWSQLLPPQLAGHCQLLDASGGQLKVQVESPSYRHELQMIGYEIIDKLNYLCPRAKIKKLKIIVGRLK